MGLSMAVEIGRKNDVRIPLVYALHSGNLYGTERMALATVEGLADRFDPVIFAPPGKALEAAERLGFAVRPFESPFQFAAGLRPFLAQNRKLAFVATGVAHSLCCIALNALYRRKISHLHVVHGGADEALSYGRKRRLNAFHVTYVAVSEFVKARLIAHGVPDERIVVVENFLPASRIFDAPRRGPYDAAGIRNALIVSRVDPIKRIDLLLDAIDRTPALNAMSFRILGTGWDLDTLRARAAERNPNVTFVGFSPDVPDALAEADLLVHLCPAEPFGLAILEAMAADVPVLAPDTGGAGSLVEEGVSGFRFRADDADDLAARLIALSVAPSDVLNRAVAGGRRALEGRFSALARTGDYRRLLMEGMG